MLVLINVVLFTTSLSAENVNQEVSAAILYIMFAIGYFVTTTACLTGAASLKRKNNHNTTYKATGTSIEKKAGATTTDLNLIIQDPLAS